MPIKVEFNDYQRRASTANPGEIITLHDENGLMAIRLKGNENGGTYITMKKRVTIEQDGSITQLSGIIKSEEKTVEATWNTREEHLGVIAYISAT